MTSDGLTFVDKICVSTMMQPKSMRMICSEWGYTNSTETFRANSDDIEKAIRAGYLKIMRVPRPKAGDIRIYWVDITRKAVMVRVTKAIEKRIDMLRIETQKLRSTLKRLEGI